MSTNAVPNAIPIRQITITFLCGHTLTRGRTFHGSTSQTPSARISPPGAVSPLPRNYASIPCRSCRDNRIWVYDRFRRVWVKNK
ncbi:hypothetical protein B0H65DRAFT_143908 [Neurospora tetraspora]|uniref:Uncharacterized protein n=1 Tax=Neurospora tetraspora TaxID=94610 RepID=A0AAE0MV19_9PEZI|nr:hypothetical protein B0H65DRAFT_143908 [Neurospora tetraspora]